MHAHTYLQKWFHIYALEKKSRIKYPIITVTTNPYQTLISPLELLHLIEQHSMLTAALGGQIKGGACLLFSPRELFNRKLNSYYV